MSKWVYLLSDASSETVKRGSKKRPHLLRPLLSARKNTASSSLGEEIIPPSLTHSQSANVTGVWACVCVCVCVKMPDGWWHETLFHVWLCLVSWGGVCVCVCGRNGCAQREINSAKLIGLRLKMREQAGCRWAHTHMQTSCLWRTHSYLPYTPVCLQYVCVVTSVF